MELLKQNEKEVVSGANIAFPASFIKPLDYSVDLLIKTHPTLRSYCKQLETTEIDPAYHIYPSVKDRLHPKDEI